MGRKGAAPTGLSKAHNAGTAGLGTDLYALRAELRAADDRFHRRLSGRRFHDVEPKALVAERETRRQPVLGLLEGWTTTTPTV